MFQVRSGQARPGQVRSGQVRLGQVRSGPAASGSACQRRWPRSHEAARSGPPGPSAHGPRRPHIARPTAPDATAAVVADPLACGSPIACNRQLAARISRRCAFLHSSGALLIPRSLLPRAWTRLVSATVLLRMIYVVLFHCSTVSATCGCRSRNECVHTSEHACSSEWKSRRHHSTRAESDVPYASCCIVSISTVTALLAPGSSLCIPYRHLVKSIIHTLIGIS